MPLSAAIHTLIAILKAFHAFLPWVIELLEGVAAGQATIHIPPTPPTQ
jgi:hypothetical protein